MTDVSHPFIPEVLVQDIFNKDCCLFVGAGISVGTHGQRGLPSASQLALELLSQCGPDNVSPATLDLRDAAQEYKEKNGDTTLRRYFVQLFNDQNLAPLRSHRALAGLPLKTIFTTNYDQLIELSLVDNKKSHKRIVDASHIPFLTSDDVAVVKLHGCVTDPPSMVITDEDYWNLRTSVDARMDLLRSNFLSTTLLFVGYGLADADFIQLYQETYQKLEGHIRRAFAVQLGPSKREVERWNRREIQIIDADATIFLEELGRRYKKKF